MHVTNPLSMDSDGDGKIDPEDAALRYADPATPEAEAVHYYTNAVYLAAGIAGGPRVVFDILIVLATRNGPKIQGLAAPVKA